ncbi:MAG: hypothetical protein IK055_09585 [Lachnospiraceae bacterium]|nr:hypothetical protein [Lachnospiraceae bacterium]
MDRRKMLLLLCLVLMACAVLVACDDDDRKAKERWAFNHETDKAVLTVYEDGSAEFQGKEYTKYEVGDKVIKMTAKDGSVDEFRYYDDEKYRYIYLTSTYDFYESDTFAGYDGSTLVGAWTKGEDKESFQFTPNGTFLEDGYWAGYYFPHDDGSIKLVYDNQVFDDTTIYYTIKDKKLTIEYPWLMIKMPEE